MFDKVLGDLPDWAVKWAALAAEYIEYERKQLPIELVELAPKLGHQYTKEGADNEAHGVYEVRLQNLAITRMAALFSYGLFFLASNTICTSDRVTKCTSKLCFGAETM